MKKILLLGLVLALTGAGCRNATEPMAGSQSTEEELSARVAELEQENNEVWRKYTELKDKNNELKKKSNENTKLKRQLREETDRVQGLEEQLETRSRQQLFGWFQDQAALYPQDFAYEHPDSVDNINRLDRFYENYRAGVPDKMYLAQQGNPLIHYYVLWYDGKGFDYYVQEIRMELLSPQRLSNLTLIDNYYYFTQGKVQMEDGVIHYERDGQEIQVEFNTFPFADDQPMKIGRNGSGWVHP